MILLKYYLVTINIIAFAMMGIDKIKAKVGMWRISEAALFIVAILGGSIGANFGMYVFRHKTMKFIFVVGMPIVLLIHIYIFYKLFR